MSEERKFASLLTDYCVEVKKGDEVLITSGLEALGLAREIYRRVLERGGYPRFMLVDDVMTEMFYRYAAPEILEYLSPIDKVLYEKVDARITIMAPSHVKPLVGIDPERVKTRSRATRELTEIFMRRESEGSLRWVLTAYPTQAMAQEAGMSPLEWREFVFRAVKLYAEDPVAEWKRQAVFQERVVKALSKVDEVKLEGEGVNLLLKVGGRTWISDDGKNNMPGGEVFTAPHEDSAEGYIEFTYPAVWRGYEVEGVRLEFSRGLVVKATARKGEEFLKKMLETDEGARRIGEFAFGLNYDINRFTKEILFDEKIGGTIHLALGASYPRTGGVNKSSIHWDMIKDMRRGRVKADDDIIYENGRFLEEVL